jgi:hypothetical protein
VRNFLAIVAAVVLAAGCGKSPPPARVLARVGETELTLDELQSIVDTTTPGWRAHIPRDVAAWVSTEMLAQEAKRTGIEDDPGFHAEWNEAYRQILARRLMSGQIYADTVSFTEEALRAYFQKHASEFFLREDVAKLNMIAFQTREQASSFAAQAVERGRWSELVSERMRDGAFSSTVVTSREGVYETRRSIYPPEAWKVATTLPLNEISFPVRTPAGYYVIQALGLYRQGAAAEFELVREEVRTRLLMEYRREKATRFIGTLRERYNVQIFVTPEQRTDSSITSPHE